MTALAFVFPFAAFVALCTLLWSVLYLGGPPLARSVRGALRWLWASAERHGRFERSRRRLEPWAAYAPATAIALGGLVVAFMLGEDFFELAAYLRAQDGTMLQVDHDVYSFARDTRRTSLTLFFEVFTRIGSPLGLTLIVGIIAALLWRQRHRPLAIYLIATAIAGGALNSALKHYFQRARPDLAAALRLASGYSFPSGHAMASIVIMSALAYVLHRLGPRWRIQSAGIASLLVTSLTIALSRVYLGVHWISDIGAGLAAGFVWFAVATTTYEVWRRIRRIRLQGMNGRGNTLPLPPVLSEVSVREAASSRPDEPEGSSS